jgi:hypothetical protein
MRYLCWALIYTERQKFYTGKIFLLIQQHIKRQIEKMAWIFFYNSDTC